MLFLGPQVAPNQKENVCNTIYCMFVSAQIKTCVNYKMKGFRSFVNSGNLMHVLTFCPVYSEVTKEICLRSCTSVQGAVDLGALHKCK